MKSLCFFFAVILVISTNGYAQTLPSFIDRCKWSDPELTRCLTSAVQAAIPHMANGIPELKVPGIDPLKVDNIRVNQPALKVQFEDAFISGLKSCKVNEFRIDPKSKKMYFNYTKNGSFNGKYQVDGRILIIPIKGEGDASIKFTNLNYYFIMDYDTVKGDDGKNHWKILKHQATYNTEKAVYRFGNLFGGNKQLSDTAHKVVNDNWQLIFNDMSPPIMKKVIRSVVNVISKFFESFPIDDIILP
ncbi:circadian clock-controlled protein daywake-like [Arctopsyche grandis]|uniref:circadian clock-controlled protein daywake-like n=1 Tax=Arctopsyche grandis TaxID=121162 RepID=UPI00406D78FF